MAEVKRVENDPSEEGPWCNLPPEILDLIAKKLPDISDFIVLSAVCKSWRSCECDPPSPLPWILVGRSDHENPNLHFHSLLYDRILTINCPKSRDKIFCGPSNHYLLGRVRTGIGYSASLLNPITNNEVDMPWFEQAMTVCGVQWIGPDPSGNGELAVFFGFSILKMIPVVILWRLGDSNTIQFGVEGTLGCKCLYCKGEVSFLNVISGCTKIFDVTTQKLVYEVPPTKALMLPSVG